MVRLLTYVIPVADTSTMVNMRVLAVLWSWQHQCKARTVVKSLEQIRTLAMSLAVPVY